MRSLCHESSTVAFISCPTAFVAFQHISPLAGARLLEVDRRFAVLTPKHYIHYDLDEPEVYPSSLKGAVDVAVVDPPFLNEVWLSSKLIASPILKFISDYEPKGCPNSPTDITSRIQASTPDVNVRGGYPPKSLH